MAIFINHCQGWGKAYEHLYPPLLAMVNKDVHMLSPTPGNG